MKEGSKPSISSRDRRDYLPFFRRREQQVREDALLATVAFIVVIFAASLLVHLFLEPKRAKADTAPFVMNKVVVIGATKQQIKSFCRGI